MASNHCPELHELLPISLGGEAPDALRRHVAACGACRARVERLRAEASAVVQAAVELPGAAGVSSPTVERQAETTSRPTTTEPGESDSTGPGTTVPTTAPRPDSVGRYRIVGELDAGGQALVYRAVHPTLPRDVAIKIAHEPSSIDQSLLKGDAEILCSLDHPNLVRVHDLDVHEGRPFIVMEFVRGRNLQQVADQSLPSLRQAAAWTAVIARAVAYVHRCGVVHQDIKPKNILIDESGRPRLIDFGVARWRHAWSEGEAGPSGGTLAFMAPEQARGESERASAASDIFGLGGALYFLLSGQAPFGGKTRDDQWRRASRCDFDRAALWAKKVPRGLERIVLKAMSPEPKDRFASADDMAAALEGFLSRPRRLAVMAAALLLAAAAMVVWSWWPRPARDAERNTLSDSSGPGKSVSKDTAPGAMGLSSTMPLRIEQLEVALHPRTAVDPSGTIGVNVFAAQLGQDARIHARLSAPGFCYLLALNPDGTTQLCYPENPEAASHRTIEIHFPPDASKGFALTDGVGTQVFVLITSAKPLRPYSEWPELLGALPWKPAESTSVWRYDGRNFESDVERGDIRPLAGLPPPLSPTCRALQSAPGVEAIRAVAFPVKPRPEPKIK
jgi:serine/threonine protein kinase